MLLAREAFLTICEDRAQIAGMGPVIPTRLTEIQISAWWRARGYPAGDAYEDFARLVRAADGEYHAIRMKALKEEIDRQRARMPQKPGSGPVKDWGED